MCFIISVISQNYKGSENMPVLNRRKVVTLQEFCEYWKISERKVIRWINEYEDFPSKRVGCSHRIFFDEANEWIDKHFNQRRISNEYKRTNKNSFNN